MAYNAMAYVAPKLNEMLICTQAGVGVYAGPSTTSTRLQTNYKHNRDLRDWAVNDEIGRVLDREPSASPEGVLFLKIQYWTWEKTSAFPIVNGGTIEQKFHVGYVKVDDEPEYWTRTEWLNVTRENTEQESKAQEITAYISTLPGIPQPTEIDKEVDDKGNTVWYLTFANGTKIDYERFKTLSPETKLKTTTLDKSKLNLSTGDSNNKTTNTSKTDGSGSSFLTTTNILLGLVVLGLFTTMLFLVLRSRSSPSTQKR